MRHAGLTAILATLIAIHGDRASEATTQRPTSWSATVDFDAATGLAQRASAYLPSKPAWATVPHVTGWVRSASGDDLRGWLPNFGPARFSASVTALAVSAYDLASSWRGVTSILGRRYLPEGARIDLHQAIAAGLEVIPQDPAWYVDFGTTSAVVGTVVGSAAFACAVVATPGGPVLVALAPAACSVVGSYAGGQIVRAGYRAWAHREVDEDAAVAGTYVGSLIGMSAGYWAIGRFAPSQAWRAYQAYTRNSDMPRNLASKAFGSWYPHSRSWNVIRPETVADDHGEDASLRH